MHTLKIRKIGNSLGIVLPKEVLASLGVSENDNLHLTRGPDDSFRITPYSEDFARQMKEAESIMNEDRDLLRELSRR